MRHRNAAPPLEVERLEANPLRLELPALGRRRGARCFLAEEHDQPSHFQDGANC